MAVAPTLTQNVRTRFQLPQHNYWGCSLHSCRKQNKNMEGDSCWVNLRPLRRFSNVNRAQKFTTLYCYPACGRQNAVAWLPIFVSGPPPVGIGHLQDGVLLILNQLQVLLRHGRVVVLCCDGRAYRGSLWLRRQRPARFLLNRQRRDGGGAVTKAGGGVKGVRLYLCRGRRERFPGCPSVWVPGKSC